MANKGHRVSVALRVSKVNKVFRVSGESKVYKALLARKANAVSKDYPVKMQP